MAESMDGKKPRQRRRRGRGGSGKRNGTNNAGSGGGGGVEKQQQRNGRRRRRQREGNSNELKLTELNVQTTVLSSNMQFEVPGAPPSLANSPFEYIAQVGQGTYGQVFKARRRTNGRLLAMKRLKSDNEDEGFPSTAAREIRLLKQLRHENIVRIEEIAVLNREVYIALDYIEHDLAGVMLNRELVIQPMHVKSLVQQMLRALAYLHKNNILHRDIKGSNVLITASGLVKLADFGLARQIDPHQKHMTLTNRVITIFYRPPELLLGAQHYGPEVDVWGVGCLLVELFIKKTLFSGRDEVSQLQAIFSVMGYPLENAWPEFQKQPWYLLLMSMGPPGLKSTSAYRFPSIFQLPQVTKHCFDIAKRLLQLNPAHRIGAKEALEHEYFKEEPRAQRLNLRTHQEWHDWEAKQRRATPTNQELRGN